MVTGLIKKLGNKVGVYDPHKWRYDLENPIKIVPADQRPQGTDLSNVMVSANFSTVDSLETLASGQLVEISGTIEHRKETQDVPNIYMGAGMRGGVVYRDIVMDSYYIICGDCPIDISSLITSVDFLHYQNSNTPEKIDQQKLREVLKESSEVVAQGFLSKNGKLSLDVHAMRTNGFSMYNTQTGHTLFSPSYGDSVWKHTINPKYEHRK